MNKTPITIWVTIKEPEIENGKIIVKKGEFYYNNKKYFIDNGEIKGATDDKKYFIDNGEIKGATND